MALAEHFPERLEFFGLGRVIRDTKHRVVAKPNFIVSFEITGDERGTCLVGFEGAINDPSMAVEMANILASKFVSNLCDNGGVLLEMNPPLCVDPEERTYSKYASYFGPKSSEDARDYIYTSELEKLRLRLVFIQAKKGTA